ncbi:hydroxymethylbilane synthase [Flavobacteriaceae bacterium MAR_2010_188]|nr:hydroxymethylbilane synthase [Flavobacteriaceae bacterium MAR_2010_188]
MSKTIRIGTRDSELAMWQANAVKGQLEFLGHKTQIVAVKSTGDLVLDKPVYDMGITGVFTRTLDIALLTDEIDIAVHSLKDVPTALPKGIVQAAVLKRGNVWDTLIFKNNEEFLGERDAVIATGSLRRKAQWLNRYPTHTIVGLRGNVNTRLQKLEDSDWNGAIFAAAGIGRINLRPEDAINLEWMVPAPAQGAVMIAARAEDEEILAICAEINHEETQICTSLEREFLKILEGGCSAPIGALAYIKDEEVHFQGVLLSLDGKHRFEQTKSRPLGEHHDLPKICANYIIDHGGKRVMSEIKKVHRKTQIFSTKSLTEEQKRRFKLDVEVESTDFIKINHTRISLPLLKSEIKNVIITSQNAVESILSSCPPEDLKFKNIYCVGRRTKRLIEKKIGKVTHSENNAVDLANYLVEYIEGTEATYFCSNIRLDELPSILKEGNIEIKEVEAYKTVADANKLDESIEGVLFYSPSTVYSFLEKNQPNIIAYCIGETTANAAREKFEDVRVAKVPTVESVIDLVNQHYSN